MTTRTVKLEESVFNELERIREKSETKSDVVARLLGARSRIWDLVNVLEGQLKFNQERARQLEERIHAGE